MCGVRSIFAQDNTVSQPQNKKVLEDPWSYDYEAVFASKYVFRGRKIYDGASFSPDLALNYRLSKREELVTKIENVLPLQGEASGREFYSVTPSVQYQVESGPGDVALGVRWCSYLGTNKPPPGDSGEILYTMKLSALLEPSLSFFQDFAQTRSRYLELGFSHEMPWDYYNKDLTLTPFVVLGYSFHSEESVYGSDGLNHVDFGVLGDLTVDSVTFRTKLNYTRAEDRQTSNMFWISQQVSF